MTLMFTTLVPRSNPRVAAAKKLSIFSLKLGQFPLPTYQNEKKEKRNRQESARKRPPRVAAAKKLSIFSSKIVPVPSGNLPKRKKEKRNRRYSCKHSPRAVCGGGDPGDPGDPVTL